ncbi:methyltransferase domain-containing protein [Candidatus Woesearchaeota archaeon]|nr:methyltransferase domain-containing protein [Candidatus Woesearchaeota archaeon]
MEDVGGEVRMIKRKAIAAAKKTQTPKIVFIKGKKQFVEDLDREVRVLKQGSYFVDDTSRDFHTQHGIIKKMDLQKGGRVLSDRGKEFSVFDASFIDSYRRIKRLAQIIPLKDLGFILAKTGVGSKSVVVEAGSGSGALSIFFARHVKHVISYDIEADHQDVAKQNAARLGIVNITFKPGSIYEKIDEKNVDLVCLDVPEPWSAVVTAKGALKQGGFLVSYSPAITQVADFVNAVAGDPDFVHLKTVEVIEREWEIDGRKVRPTSKSIIHSGFLSFARRL